jgi:hypothetical protein
LFDDECSDLISNTADALELHVVTSLTQRVNVDDFGYYLLRWMVNRQVPLTEVEDEDFRRMLLCLSQTIDPYLVYSGDTIRNWVEEEYLRAKRQVVQYISEAKKVKNSY